MQKLLISHSAEGRVKGILNSCEGINLVGPLIEDLVAFSAICKENSFSTLSLCKHILLW